MVCFFFFFFSSRRRHTRFDCDWSSDVCSSDLLPGFAATGWFSVVVRAGTPRPVIDKLNGVLMPFLQRPERSEEHTSELQSQSNLVCRLLLEKKKKKNKNYTNKYT